MFKFVRNPQLFIKRKLRKQATIIRESGLFDEDWYLLQYPDVVESGVDPILHYLKFGAYEGRFPNPEFDSAWYLEEYEDVRSSGGNPLIHYILYGRSEGRQPTITAEPLPGRATTSNLGDLTKKLWGGFSHYAVSAIEEFAADSENSKKEQALARYTLARWYASSNNWAACYENLREIRKLDLKFYRAKRTKLLLVESLNQQA